MVWKKNVFSYPLWILYAIAADLGLVCLADAICDSMGAEIHIGTYVSAIYVVAAGVMVFLLHRFAPKYAYGDGRNHAVRTTVETAAAVTLLAIGLVLRARVIGPEVSGTAYYDAAALVPGEGIPQIAHGAVYVYLQALRGLLYFTGNKLMAAVWAQIVIQLAAVLLLYLAMRRLAGNIAALVTLAFHIFSFYLTGEAVILSPAMLYLLLWALLLFLISLSAVETRSPGWYFATGILIAAVSYLDVAGCLLLFIAAGVFLHRREEDPGNGRRFLRLSLCVAGAAAGFCGLGMADAQLSGKKFAGVMYAWLRQYWPEDFQVPMLFAEREMLTECIIIFCVLSLGAFSFWRSKRNDYMASWLLLLGILAAAGCFGVFTQEVPIGLYVYLVLTVMAGVAVETCVRRETAPELIQPEAGEEASGAPEENRESAGAEAVKEPSKAPEENRESAGAEAVSEPSKAPEENRESAESEAVNEPLKAPEESRESAGAEAVNEPPKAPEESRVSAGAEAVSEPSKAPEKSRESAGAETVSEPSKAPEESHKPEKPKAGEESSKAAEEGQEPTKTKAGEETPRKPVQLIENPLPLPKKHVKKKLDYNINVAKGQDDFDLDVDETDDFDI